MTAATTQPVARDAPPKDPAPPFHVTFNLDFTNAYFFRGIIEENQGFIIQPAAKFSWTVVKDDDSQLDLFACVWNSIHDHSTNVMTSDVPFKHCYESDLTAGVSYALQKFTFGASYYFFTSPSSAFDTVQEVDLSAGFDDSNIFGTFAVHPYALIAIETNSDGSENTDGKRGTYLELGIAPGFDLDLGSWKLPLTFPASVGLSLDHYYDDASNHSDTFGFAQAGVKTSIPLPFGGTFGTWTLNAGASGLFLGDHTAGYDAGDHFEFIATIGAQLDF